MGLGERADGAGRAVSYANIRELLPLAGRRVLDVTQHDEADYLAGDPAFIAIHFDDGTTVTIVIDDSSLVHVKVG